MLRRFRRKALGNSVHSFIEKTSLADLACGPNTYSFGTQVFKFTDLTNFGNFRQLFDLYKIQSVTLKIFPRFNVSAAEYQSVPGTAGALPLLAIAPNRDPYVPSPVNWADCLNDDGCRVYRMDKPITVTLSRPKPAIVTDGAGGTPQLVPLMLNVSQQPWLTTGGNSQIIDQSAVPHYGFRWAIWNQGPYDVALNVIATYRFLLKEQD